MRAGAMQVIQLGGLNMDCKICESEVEIESAIERMQNQLKGD